MYPNETTRAYICYRKTILTQSQKGAKFTHKIHKIAFIIRHFTRAPWHTDIHNDALYKAQSCLWVEPIWIDSENRFTPLFARYTTVCATLKSKRQCNSKRSETIDACYCLVTAVTPYTACILGFQFVARSNTRYRILYRSSALKVFIAVLTSLITCIFKWTVKSVLYCWTSSNQLTHHS